jgi:hypothetical protein
VSEKPKVNLEFNQVFCPWHGEPLRADWPRGYGQASVALFGVFAELDEVLEYTRADAHNLNEALAEFGPMCCAVGAEKMLSIYKRIGIGDFGTCDSCGNLRKGTPYRMKEPGGVRSFEHVCFECVVRRMKPEPPV